MKRFLLHTALLPLLACLSACGSDDEPFTASKGSSLADADNVRIWANGASAYGVYGQAYEAFAVADDEHTYPDPVCPVVEDDGTTLTITGQCTDANGDAWVGTATVVRSANGDRALTLDGFGNGSDVSHDAKTGEAHLRVVDDMNTDFELDITHEGGIVTTFVYSGRIQGGYAGKTVWNGSGTVTRDGDVEPSGSVDATTADEVIDNDVCSGQPSSGNTTITNEAGETAVVTYDGAVDCDDDQAASYSLDGKPKGKLTGIACTVSPGEAGSGGEAWLLVAALGSCLSTLRRRARRDRGDLTGF
jgi:hypothetical protein